MIKMKKGEVGAVLGLASGTLLFVHGSVMAGEAETSAEQMETVVVTATREEERALDTPAAISSKGTEEIRLDQVLYQKDLLNSLAGVRISQTGSTLGHMTAIRMPLNTGPYYLFLQDGIPVQSSGFFNHNGLAYTNFGSAHGVEVLKGAGTALYGSDAVAATVNVLTRDPGDESRFRGGFRVGSDSYWRLGIGGDAVLGDNGIVGGDYSRAESDGWREHTAWSRDELSAVHLADLDGNNRLRTVFLWNKTDAEMAGSLIGLDALEEDRESVGDIADVLNSGIPIKRKFDFMRLSTQWTNTSFENTVLDGILYLRSNRNRYVATWNDNLPQNDTQLDTFGLLLKADMQHDRLRSIFGLDFEYTKAEQKYDQLFDYVPTGWGSPVPAGAIYDYDVDYTAVAPYVRLEYRLAEQWTLGAGLRYDASRFEYTNNTADGRYATSDYFRVSDDHDYTFHHWSPKLDLSWNPDENQLVYARYANGFRIPQASRLYMRKVDNAEYSLDPETTDTFELGYKATLGTHYVELAAYYMIIDDTIVRRTNTAGEDYYVNGGKTLHKGLEVTLVSHWTDEWSTGIAYSHSKHNYDDDENYGDNEQANAPNDLANVRIHYRPEWAPGLTSMLEWQYVDSWWMDDANKYEYDGYDLWNLKFSYNLNESVDLYAKIDNLTDEVYAERATYSWGKEKYTPGGPRQFYLGVETRW